MASVADIKAVSYDVCGVVRTVDSGYKAKVTSRIVFFSLSVTVFKEYLVLILSCFGS